jgi:hypothetical protein
LRALLPLALALLGAGCETNDHIKPNDWEAEGSVSVGHSGNDFTDTNAIEANALLNLAITSGFQIGPLLAFEAVDGDLSDGTDVDTISYMFAPNFRFNLPGSETVLPYIDLAAGSAYVDVDKRLTTSPHSHESASGLFLQGGVGIRIFISERAAINLAARYRYLFIANRVGGNTDTYGLFCGLSVFF